MQPSSPPETAKDGIQYKPAVVGNKKQGGILRLGTQAPGWDETGQNSERILDWWWDNGHLLFRRSPPCASTTLQYQGLNTNKVIRWITAAMCHLLVEEERVGGATDEETRITSSSAGPRCERDGCDHWSLCPSTWLDLQTASFRQAACGRIHQKGYHVTLFTF